jgi:enediyne biosynthesis protein E4
MTNQTKADNSKAPWVVGAVMAAAAIFFLVQPDRPPAPPTPVGTPAAPTADSALKESIVRLLAEQQKLDESLWADEVDAQRYEQPFVRLWDRLRSSKNPWEELAAFGFTEAGWPGKQSVTKEGSGLVSTSFGGAVNAVARAEVLGWLRSFSRKGYKLVQSEWHHARFEKSTNGPPRSDFNVTLHISAPTDRQIELKGKLSVEWKTPTGTDEAPIAEKLIATEVQMLERTGKPAFQEHELPLLKLRVALPVMAHDVDGDRLSEIIVPAHNVIMANKGGFKFERSTLMDIYPEGLTTEQMMIASAKMAAVLDEFTGDDLPDLVVALPPHGVFLYEMQSDRRFSGMPKRILTAGADLRFPTVITSGDINGDGRTDLWIGQYRESILSGELPEPIFDANSGYPAFLLVNEGQGRFAEKTDIAGLGERRNRWTYSGSFWDFDSDGDLDLITVNDFSGVDAYQNIGQGTFTTVTEKFVDERANFGMGHTIADFNRDGHLDFFVTGMSSTTARRLEALGLGREEFPEIQRLRMKMAYGNRAYFGSGNGTFVQPELKDQLARTGWSWGVGVLDFGNDGWPDLYVANGHISKQTCRDYCTRFWTHDIYLDSSAPKEVRATMFDEIDRNWIAAGASWNGFEKNVLFLNRNGKRFISAGFPMGVAFEYDSRSVLVDDFDLDGRQDLLVSQLDSTSRRDVESLHLYRNVWEENGNCIGFCLRPGGGMSAMGTRITIESAMGKQSAVIVNGDSFYTQHSTTRLFGLGKDTHVRKATITWPNGKTTIMEHPKINEYHVVKTD